MTASSDINKRMNFDQFRQSLRSAVVCMRRQPSCTQLHRQRRWQSQHRCCLAFSTGSWSGELASLVKPGIFCTRTGRHGRLYLAQSCIAPHLLAAGRGVLGLNLGQLCVELMYPDVLHTRFSEHTLRMTSSSPSRSTSLLFLQLSDKGGFVKGGDSACFPVSAGHPHVAAGLALCSLFSVHTWHERMMQACSHGPIAVGPEVSSFDVHMSTCVYGHHVWHIRR